MTSKPSPCPVIGCTGLRKHGRLLCLHHWRRMSRNVQREVRLAWDAYLHAPDTERQTSLLQYREAVNAAIAEASSK